MKDDYYGTSRRKSESYLYYALVTTGFTILMIVISIIALLSGARAAIIVTGFVSGLLWGAASFISFRIFYRDNRASLKNDSFKSDDT